MKTMIPVVSRIAAVAAVLGGVLFVAASSDERALLDQELGNCDVDTANIGSRIPRMFVYEDYNSTTEEVTFTIDNTTSGVATISSYDKGATPKILSGGKAWTLVFTLDAANKYDVVVSEAGGSVATWADTPAIGTFDEFGMYSTGYEQVSHPDDPDNKKCIRVWFQLRGLRGGFLVFDV